MTTNQNTNLGTQGVVQQAGAGSTQTATAQLSGEPADLGQALRQLNELVTALAKKLDEQSRPAVVQDLKRVEAELGDSAAPPIKAVVLTSLERIGKAAQSVGEYAAPIMTVVKAILAFAGLAV
jgi:hypothetical protein